MTLILSACTMTSPAAATGKAGSSGAATNPASTSNSTSNSNDSASLRAYDWEAVTLPASSCDPAATGDIALAGGRGTVQVDAQTVYDVALVLPPDFGEVAGQPAAVLRYSCLLEGANGVGAFPIAVFVVGANGPEDVGILQHTELGMTANGSTISHDAVSFVADQIVVTGKYLTDTDSRCCASGIGWTSIALVYGRLAPSGVIGIGAPPATLPPRGARKTGDLIVYDPPVRVQKQTDLTYLEGAPRDFADFVWSLKLQTNATGCDSVIAVSRLSLSGFALGDEGCDPPSGGSEMLLAKHNGRWSVVMQLQNTPACAELTAAGFPAEVLGEDPQCRDATNATVPYAG